MELYYVTTDAERLLRAKADHTHTPIGGTMELLPLCNMDCRMCYVRQTREEMERQGHMLSGNEWLEIAEQARGEGLLFLLLTGGEPLLYPEFEPLYTELSRMGLILSVNTNGTLIDEKWADFFAEHGCRRLNITLYGKDNATYQALCRNPKGFTQVINAAHLLKERNVAFRFTCSITPYNVGQLEDFYRIAEKMDAPLSVATYMFPPARRGREADSSRLTAEQSAQAMLHSYHLKNRNADLKLAAQATLAGLNNPPRLQKKEGFICHAGHSGFWMNWKGEMLPCGMFNEPKISLREHSFAECWNYIVQKCRELPKCAECLNCRKQNVCRPCPAHNYTETGSTSDRPGYLCRMTNEKIRLCEEIVSDEK